MSPKFGYSVLLFVFTLFCDFAAALYKGDKCLKDGSDGICKFITECPGAAELLKAGVYPTICGLETNELIICCKDDVTKTNGNVTSRITDRKPGDISKQKCKEYAQYAYEMVQSPTLLFKPHVSKTLECDLPKYKLVIGGTVASRREFPHMALIGYKVKGEVQWKCGGSLISENFVLTAAQCSFIEFTRRKGPAAVVRVGLTNKTDLDHMQERTVSEIIPHPEFKQENYHDIGLLRLSKNVDFNTYARPACLQTERHILHDKAIASGWGAIQLGDGVNDVLLKVVLEFFSADTCNNTYIHSITSGRLKHGIIDDLMICAGVTTDVRGINQGDGGGPLQVYHEETEDIKCMYDIIGVISFGNVRGLVKNVPDVQTRVSAYIKWIEDTVWPN